MGNYPVNDLQCILQSVTYTALISLDKHDKRRGNALLQLEQLDIEAEWVRPVEAESIDLTLLPSAFLNAPNYASHALTILNVFDKALLRNASNFMHVEDDVIFDPQIRKFLPQIVVPNDWKFIYIGGRNCGSKQRFSSWIVKSSFVSDLHAVIMRIEMIDVMRDALLDRGIASHYCDARLASLHQKYPTYLCRPNLAWQSIHSNESGDGLPDSNYNEDGSVKLEQGD